MKSNCDRCPYTKEYYDLKWCAECGANHLLLNLRTNLVVCDVCGATVGVSIYLERPCFKDIQHKAYTMSIDSKLNKHQLLDFSKMIGLSGADTYRLFKENTPVILDNVPMIQTYILQKYLRSIGASVGVNPALDEYERFEDCWKI